MLTSARQRSVPLAAGLRLAVGLAPFAILLACAGSGTPAATTAAPAVATAPAPTPVVVEPHGEWAEAILYFVILDRFADGDSSNNPNVDVAAKGAFHGGDLAGLRRELDELAELGVTALWITPVVDNVDGFVTGAGFPDWAYHGYWADDFNRVDPRFGSEEELAALVADAHARGIAVLLDVVYNHAGYDSRYLGDPATRGWLRAESRGECGNDELTSCVAGLPDFKTELPEVAAYLLAAHLSLAERVGLDGFRLDTVKHVSHDFWREHRQRTRERLGSDFFLLGEVWGGDEAVLDPWFAGDEMDAGFDFAFQGNTLAFVQGRGRPQAYGRYLEKRHAVRAGHHLAHYLGSHDVPTTLHQLGGDLARFRLAVLLQLTTLGIPTIYYGEEVGRVGGEWPENRSDFPWGERQVAPGAGKARNEELRAYYRRLIQIRRAHPALWRGDHRGIAFGPDLLVFLRRDAATGDEVVVAINRGDTTAKATFPRPAAWAAAPATRDLVSGEPLALAGSEVELEVPPLTGRILVAAPAASDAQGTTGEE